MIKIKFWACTIGRENEPFLDEAYVSSPGNEEQDIKNVINEFNEEEDRRYGEQARFRRFIKLGEEPPIIQHTWTKLRFGQKDRAGIHDIWQCEQCKIIRKVYTLDGAPRAGNCYPERTCEACQKVYSTRNRFLKHKCKEK